MSSYAVIVVGAGPAGTTAARVLAEAGVPVLILERDHIPRVKPCGGALTHRVLPLLPRGAETQFQAHPTHWTFQGRSGNAVTVSRDEPYCHIVERQYFDQFLAQAAHSAGAAVRDGEALERIEDTPQGLQLVTSHGQYHADLVIAADGAHGITAKAVGFPRPQLGAAIEAEVPVDDSLWAQYESRVEIHVGRYPWGYAWVIPRAGVLNVGVGSFRPRVFPLKQRFHEFAASIVGDRPIQPLAHPLPYRLRFAPPVVRRVLFAGDAAGYMDAFSAEGIYSALRSGQLAGETALQALATGAPLSQYADRLHDEFWPSLKAAVKMGLLFYPLAGFWSDFFAENQMLLSDYLDVAMGKLPYHALRANTERALLTHPRTLLAHRH